MKSLGQKLTPLVETKRIEMVTGTEGRRKRRGVGRAGGV
jgi:hypothetical protein